MNKARRTLLHLVHGAFLFVIVVQVAGLLTVLQWAERPPAPGAAVAFLAIKLVVLGLAVAGERWTARRLRGTDSSQRAGKSREVSSLGD